MTDQLLDMRSTCFVILQDVVSSCLSNTRSASQSTMELKQFHAIQTE